MTRIVVGLFDDFTTAISLVEDLVEHGFAAENISLIANDQTGQYSNDSVHSEDYVDDEKGVLSIARLGAALGGIGGLLVGLGTFLIPGVGPLLAAGPIVAVLGGAGIGALAGGFVGALTESGVSEDDANIFAEGVLRGGVLVLAYVPNERADQAAELMNRYHPVDIDQRVEDWKDINWAGEGTGPGEFAFDRRQNLADTSRRPKGRPASRARAYTGQGTTPQSTAGLEEKAQAEIEQDDWRMYESRFREHFENVYAAHGSWQDYRESYRYGFEHGNQGYYPNSAWEEIAPEMRLGWEKEHRTWYWDDHAEAVRQGWLVRRPAR